MNLEIDYNLFYIKYWFFIQNLSSVTTLEYMSLFQSSLKFENFVFLNSKMIQCPNQGYRFDLLFKPYCLRFFLFLLLSFIFIQEINKDSLQWRLYSTLAARIKYLYGIQDYVPCLRLLLIIIYLIIINKHKRNFMSILTFLSKIF